MGRYLVQAIAEIPTDEIETAADDGYPAALVIVAQPYRDQILSHLEGAGHVVDTRRESGHMITREEGISMLKMDRASNLGWRIVLGKDSPSIFEDAVVATADGTCRLVDVLSDEYCEDVLAEVDAYVPSEEVEVDGKTPPRADVPVVRVTSFEGAKGLSAQHVYIAGLHDGEFPYDSASIKDLEICKFVVALSRTRKKCTLIRTRNFAGKWKKSSSFISWIDPARLEFIGVDKQYWNQKAKMASGK